MAATKVNPRKIDPNFVAERQEAIKENITQLPVEDVKVAPPASAPAPEVVADSTTTEIVDGKTKKAGFMGIPTIAWVALIGVGVYYAYSKGMFKKLLK